MAGYSQPTSTWLFGLPGVEAASHAPSGRRSRRKGSSQLDLSAHAVPQQSMQASMDLSWVVRGGIPAEMLADDDDEAVRVVKAAQREKRERAAAKVAEKQDVRDARKAAARERREERDAANLEVRTTTQSGRYCHSTPSLTVVPCHSFGIYIVILLSFSAKMG
jgi:hypothetical protein